MALSRLPVPGQDDGTWGEILNDYLLVAHNADGTIKSSSLPNVDVSTKADKTYVDTQLATKASSSSLAAVATSGAYNDLSGKPTIPADATLVHLSGAETVTGAKNFTGGLQIGGSNAVVTSDARLSDERTPADGSVSTAKLQEASITEPKLSITNSPSTGQFLSWNGSDLEWKAQAATLVSSVNGRTGDVVVVKADVGLTNVDNTSDLGKPISTAVQTALNAKADAGALSSVATSGSYNDLSNKPTIPVAGTTASTYAAGNDARLTGALQTSTVTAKGDILAATGNSAVNTLSLGSNNQVLTVDTTQATGLKWSTPANAPVASVAGKTGVVTLATADIAGLSSVAASGSYDDLSNKPTIPVAGTTNGTYASGNDGRITGALQTSTATTKGDIFAATAGGTVSRLGLGSNNQVLTVDTTQATGLKWAAPASAPVTSVAGKTGVVTLAASDVSGLSTVATSGSYADLSAKPTIPTAGTGLTSTAGVLSVNYGTSGTTAAAGNDARITGAVQASVVTTKGDLLVASGSGTLNRVPAGTNDQVLTADSSQPTGVKWASAASASQGIGRSIVSVVADMNADAAASTDYIYILTTNHTLTMPAAANNTNRYTIKNSLSVPIPLAFHGSETADGGPLTLGPSESVDLVSDGTNWIII